MQKKSIKITSVALKIASRCNLNCSYCYIYNMGDDTYKSQPKFMSWEIVEQTFERIKEHCRIHDNKHFVIYLFGGEPFLAGKKYIKKLCGRAREVLEPEIKLTIMTQTNGTFIDDEWIQMLEELDVGFGISLDGPKEINDKYRVDHKGNGSYDKVMEGVALLKEHGIRPGFNSVVNLEADPVETYWHFKNIGSGIVDFLVPDGNFYQYPPQIHSREFCFHWDHTPYGDWLISVFNEWFHDKNPKPKIRIFNQIMNIILGGRGGYDYVGTMRNQLVIIESDGAIEAADDFKICGNGFTKNDVNIFDNTFDEALETELVSLYNLSKEKLCKQCNICPVKDVCGGWYVPTRFSKKNGFNNPSVFCPDVLKLITHIQNKIVFELEKAGKNTLGMVALTYEEAYTHLEENTTGEVEPEYAIELETFKKLNHE